jgi:hypothetical protein
MSGTKEDSNFKHAHEITSGAPFFKCENDYVVIIKTYLQSQNITWTSNKFFNP